MARGRISTALGLGALCAALAAGVSGCSAEPAAPRVRDMHAPADLLASPDQSTPADQSVPPDLLEPDLAMCPPCDDNVACTVDICLSTTACDHQLDHSKCSDEQLCTLAGCTDVTRTRVCSTCDTSADCGPDEVCGTGTNADGGTSKYCLPLCSGNTSCPKGFSCDQTMSPARCVPDSLCCIDADGDKHGYGAGCLGTDCDDHDSDVYQGKPEICDGKDNDCNGTVDDGYLCGGPSCSAVSGTGTYQGTPIRQCKVGNCVDVAPASCGKYTCELVSTPVPGSDCRTSCSGTDDTACITSAYCDGAACSDRLPDGSACGRDRMCTSGHCQNGHCCGGGDCCATAADCPATYAHPATCDSPLTSCQGHRVDKTCTTSMCGSTNVDDDSACDSSISKSCSPLAPVTCTGASSQSPLACPTSCTKDADCVDPTTLWCQNPGPSGKCVSKVPDGNGCTADDQCVQGHHCLNGFCCNATSGYCCGGASDCPAAVFSSAPTCDAPNTNCQGHRYDRTCSTAHICGSTYVADDTACTSAISLGCGNYLPVACSGAFNQSGLTCPTSCTADWQCTSGNHCYQNQCVPWVGDGGSCQSGLQCTSGNCWDGAVCCDSSCNNTACDSCWGGTCNYFTDWNENPYCSSSALASGHFNNTYYATIQNDFDADDWFHVYCVDMSNACFWPINDYGHLVADVSPASGEDISVEIWKGNGDCSGLSFKAGNGTHHADFQEDCGADDTGDYFIRVRRLWGSNCSQDYSVDINCYL